MPMDGKTQTCGFLDQMSTEQLYDLIRTDFESSEEGNTDLTIRILEVIKERERKEHPENSTDVKKAWDTKKAVQECVWTVGKAVTASRGCCSGGFL